jgi:hypothetical protein
MYLILQKRIRERRKTKRFALNTCSKQNEEEVPTTNTISGSGTGCMVIAGM